MKRVLNLLLLGLILGSSAGISAQQLPPQPNGPGAIRGTVLDPHEAVIPGAEVRATNNQTGESFQTRSNDEGSFALTGLPFGDYSLLITAPGFAKFNTQISLSSDAPSSAHNSAMILAVGQFSITAHMIDVGTTGNICVVCGYTYFSIPYADLPLFDRDPQQLVSLQSGVSEHKARFSIGGRRAENKTALLDGFDNRDPATGQFTATLNLDSLSDFNTDYTAADTTVSSSYGQNSAPQLAANSRSGTNQYHGVALWHLQRTGMSANGLFTNRGGLPRDQAMYDQAAFTLGGNISAPGLFSGKDHAFFFVSFEGTRDRQTTGRQIIAPLESFVKRTSGVQGSLFRASLLQGRFPLASGNGLQDVDGDGLNDIGDATVRSSSSFVRKLSLVRVDLRPADRVQLNLRFFGDRSEQSNEFAETVFTPASPLDATGRGELAGVQLTAEINSRTINDFRIGYLKGMTDLAGAGSDAPQLIAVNTPLSVGGGLPELPERHHNRAFILADNFARMAGAHSLSAGAQFIRRNEHYTSEGLGQGRIYYADALALITDGAQSGGDPLRSIVRAELQQHAESEQYRFADLYAFANDNWRAGPRFVLNFGSAYNIYSGAIYERRTDRNNFAPFASFAFAPTHSESIILRGGVALLYVPPTRLAYGEIKATPLYPAATGFARPGEIAGVSVPRTWASRDDSVEIEREYADDIRTGYTESAFLFLQRSMGERLIIEAGYNSTFGHRLTQAYRANRPSLSSSIDGGATPFSNEETILIASDGNSSYHSFQVKVTSRERRRITFQAHYTFSKSIDTTSDDTPSMFRSIALGPVADGNHALERGPSDFDRRHRAVGFFLWRGPEFERSRNRFRWVLAGWCASGIVRAQSGPLVSLYSSGDFYGGSGDFNGDGLLNDRLAYYGGGSVNRSINRGNAADGYFDPTLFGAPSEKGHVQLGRNVLPAPGFASIDLSAQKRFPLRDAHRVDLRIDVFNLTNRANFAPPVTDFMSADFGRSVATGRPRIVRLAVKYSF